jgi:hypothetical protein
VITLKRFRRIEEILRLHGYGPMIDWSETIQPPASAEEFASEAIYVICNSGMAVTVGTYLAERSLAALAEGQSATSVFGHPGKAPAIDWIWERREQLFEQYQAAEQKLEFLETLPWIGPVTRYHLAKNFGADEAKPDVHMERLARRDRTTTATLCRRLARMTGYRIATVDSILWRACADGVLSSRAYEADGWKGAFRPHALKVEFERLDVTDISIGKPDGSSSEAGPSDKTPGE